MRVSLKDVALHAGVSIKTVSNVVNDYQHVTPGMRARVQASIDELGYQPNLTARHLRKGRTGIIALALPELGNPYFAELATEIINAAAEHDYTVLLDHTRGRRDQEILVSQGFRTRVIDGLVLSPIELEAEDLRSRTEQVPLVLLGEREYDLPHDHIAIDNVAAARAAVRHLIGLGRRNVAFIGARRGHSQPAHLRLRGWRDELDAAGLVADSRLVAATDGWEHADGARAMAGLLDSGRRPDAVFAYNDLIAIGALRALSERGLRVPEDVAVVGFDDVAEGRFGAVTLTSVSPDKAAIARMAVESVLAQLNGGEQRGRRIRPGYRLEKRESTLGTSGALAHSRGPTPSAG
ncbi:LacI family transcriptional regulator [Streptomyces sp. CS113]|uniref:LacI family DNA-binding transcriptional regulator n=1 Tax=Streptomyces sp. CS113 TaxID=1982761 RepID=UPI000B40AE42|nr:LacI family DNA-binding transcriptional regulator [Streptomyces sp. CS113]OWA13302.1 LacI family transcriptional regulator [Streptomyces sp. CS113]